MWLLSASIPQVFPLFCPAFVKANRVLSLPFTLSCVIRTFRGSTYCHWQIGYCILSDLLVSRVFFPFILSFFISLVPKLEFLHCSSFQCSRTLWAPTSFFLFFSLLYLTFLRLTGADVSQGYFGLLIWPLVTLKYLRGRTLNSLLTAILCYPSHLLLIFLEYIPYQEGFRSKTQLNIVLYCALLWLLIPVRYTSSGTNQLRGASCTCGNSLIQNFCV